MHIPTRIQQALGALIVGGVPLTGELGLSSPLYKLVLLVAGVTLFLLQPQDRTPAEATAEIPTAPAPPLSATTAFPPPAA